MVDNLVDARKRCKRMKRVREKLGRGRVLAVLGAESGKHRNGDD